MQPERKDTVLFAIAVILGIVAVGAITLALIKRGGGAETTPEPAPAEESPAAAKQEETAPLTNIPTVAPDPSPSEEVVKIQAPEPEPLTENVEARIQDIADRIGRGEITREEGQRQINELLGI